MAVIAEAHTLPGGALSFGYRIDADDPVAPAAEHGLALFRQGRLDQALPFLRQGANDGDRRAQYVLATALFNGDGGERDVAAAFRWMRRARDAGLAQAGDSLAEMARLVPEQANAPAEDIGPLLSSAALDTCRRLVAERLAPPPSAGSLDVLMRAMVAAELRARLDDLIPKALDRSL